LGERRERTSSFSPNRGDGALQGLLKLLRGPLAELVADALEDAAGSCAFLDAPELDKQLGGVLQIKGYRG